MKDVAIKVENLSKRYRIGLKEETKDTLFGVLGSILESSFQNLKRLKKLTSFNENKNESDDIIWALKDISFEVKKGEVLGIIGPNGAGKSTLLKIIAQITYPTSGMVKLDGRVASLLEVGTGFHPELTGRENIYLNGTILGMTKKEIDQKFDEIVDFSDIEKFIDTPVKRYSSGMGVRLGFSVAAHLDPEILLIDEVLAVGDLEFQQKCLQKIDDIGANGRTVIFVSHNIRSISALSNKCLLIENGKIIKNGSTNIVTEYYLNKNQQQLNHYFDNLLSNPVERSGNGKARISKIMLLESVDNDVVHFNEKFSIQIEFIVSPGINVLRYYFIVNFKTKSDKIIFKCDSRTYFNGYHSKGRNNGKIILEIQQFPLTPGEYILDFFMKEDGRRIDAIKDQFIILVVNRTNKGLNSSNSNYHFYVKNKWIMI